MSHNLNSKLLFNYYDWLKNVRSVVENQVLLVSRNPNDSTVIKKTDELHCDGYSLKGQDIETSRATGNVFIKTDLLTFAHWLEQYESMHEL